MFNLIILYIASLLAYISKEMVYPILPLYLSVTLGMTPIFIGLIEGITKSIASIIKFYSGYFSDRIQNRKRFVIIGFLGFLIHKIFLLFSFGWISVITAKIFERIGKAIEIAPRNAILAEGSKESESAKVFSYGRFFDKLGATIGIILVYILFVYFGVTNFKEIFFISIIPITNAIIILFFIKQDSNRGIININLNKIKKPVQIFFCFAFFSSLANTSKSFLLLKASESGFDYASVILLYLAVNLTACLVSIPVGKFCQKIAKPKIISLAYIILAFMYFFLSITNNHTIITFLFISYGLFVALISVAAKSFIVDNVSADMKATALGINECLINLATLPAAIIGGFLWETFGSSSSFLLSSLINILSAIGILYFLKGKDQTNKYI